MKRMSLIGLIAATYFMVSGGPYGIEDLVGQAGYGYSLLILCLIPILWSLPTALMVGELASAIPDTGGFYIWVRRGLGNFWGFQEAWLSLTASVFDMGIYPLLFISYLGALSPSLVRGWHGPAIATALIVTCLYWNLKGAKAVGEGSIWMGLVMVSPFVLITIVGLYRSSLISTHDHLQLNFMGGVLVAMWNFMGWDNASTIATEVENPQRNYPMAMISTLILIVISYALPVLAMWHYGIPINNWATGSWASIGGTVAGTLVRDVIVIGGMISSAGMLNSLMMSYSRIPVALALDGYLPKIFTKVNQTSVPLIALFSLTTVWLAALGLNFNKLVMLDILLYGSSLILEFLALAMLRWKEPNLERPFRIPGKFGAVTIGIAPTLLLIFAAFYSDHDGLVLGFCIMIAGVLAWFICSHRARTSH